MIRSEFYTFSKFIYADEIPELSDPEVIIRVATRGRTMFITAIAATNKKVERAHRKIKEFFEARHAEGELKHRYKVCNHGRKPNYAK